MQQQHNKHLNRLNFKYNSGPVEEKVAYSKTYLLKVATFKTKSHDTKQWSNINHKTFRL